MTGQDFLEPSAAMPRGKHRIRASHQRSRNGCTTCKKRHIRCDEGKPVCTRCLVRGSDCRYTATENAAPSRDPSRSRSPLSTPSPDAVNSASPILHQSAPEHATDPWQTLLTDMPDRSHEMLEHYLRYRSITKTLIPQHTSIIESALRASNEPLHIHNVIIFGCMHVYWLSGCSIKMVEPTLRHHKGEMIRIVQQRLAESADGTHSAPCVHSIGSLGIIEGAFGEIEAGNLHIRGLFALIEKKKSVQESAYQYYKAMQRFVLMMCALVSAIHKSAVAEFMDAGNSNSTPVSDPLETTFSLFLPATEGSSGLVPNYFTDDHTTPVPSPTSGVSPRRPVSSSPAAIPAKAWTSAMYILTHIMLEFMWNPADPVSPQLARWLTDSPPMPVSYSENPNLWLWKTVLGAYLILGGAILTERTPTNSPAAGMDAASPVFAARSWFDEAVARWVAVGGGYTGPDTGSEVLDRILWLDEEDGKLFLRAVWDEAMRTKMGSVSPEDLVEGSIEGLRNLELGDG